MITYNHEKFIREAIEGVLMQKTDFHFELIIGEDCSTDNTRNIVLEYASKYPDIIRPLLPQKNLGMFKNFVETLKVCKGKYIALCEGDDYWIDPLKLQKQVEYFKANQEAVICFTNRKIIDINGVVLSFDTIPDIYKRKFKTNELIGVFTPPTQTIMLKANYLYPLVLNIDKNIYNGDTYIFWYLSQFGETGYLDETTAVYRNSGMGIYSSASSVKRLENALKTLTELKKVLYASNKFLLNKPKMYIYFKLFVSFTKKLRLLNSIKYFSLIVWHDILHLELNTLKAFHLLIKSIIYNKSSDD